MSQNTMRIVAIVAIVGLLATSFAVVASVLLG